MPQIFPKVKDLSKSPLEKLYIDNHNGNLKKNHLNVPDASNHQQESRKKKKKHNFKRHKSKKAQCEDNINSEYVESSNVEPIEKKDDSELFFFDISGNKKNLSSRKLHKDTVTKTKLGLQNLDDLLKKVDNISDISVDVQEGNSPIQSYNKKKHKKKKNKHQTDTDNNLDASLVTKKKKKRNILIDIRDSDCEVTSEVSTSVSNKKHKKKASSSFVHDEHSLDESLSNKNRKKKKRLDSLNEDGNEQEQMPLGSPKKKKRRKEHNILIDIRDSDCEATFKVPIPVNNKTEDKKKRRSLLVDDMTENECSILENANLSDSIAIPFCIKKKKNKKKSDLRNSFGDSEENDIKVHAGEDGTASSTKKKRKKAKPDTVAECAEKQFSDSSDFINSSIETSFIEPSFTDSLEVSKSCKKNKSKKSKKKKMSMETDEDVENNVSALSNEVELKKQSEGIPNILDSDHEVMGKKKKKKKRSVSESCPQSTQADVLEGSGTKIENSVADLPSETNVDQIMQDIKFEIGEESGIRFATKKKKKNLHNESSDSYNENDIHQDLSVKKKKKVKTQCDDSFSGEICSAEVENTFLIKDPIVDEEPPAINEYDANYPRSKRKKKHKVHDDSLLIPEENTASETATLTANLVNNNKDKLVLEDSTYIDKWLEQVDKKQGTGDSQSAQDNTNISYLSDQTQRNIGDVKKPFHKEPYTSSSEGYKSDSSELRDKPERKKSSETKPIKDSNEQNCDISVKRAYSEVTIENRSSISCGDIENDDFDRPNTPIIWDRNVDEEDMDADKLHKEPIEVPFEVCPLHSLLTRSSVPPKNQMDQIKALKLELKAGPFSKEEDEKIMENWRKFYEDFDFSGNPRAFVKMSRKLPQKQITSFLRHLGRGLDNRLLHRIYARFRTIVQKEETKRGRFSVEEDRKILRYIEKSRSQCPFSDLSKILKRPKHAISKRYDKLKEYKETSSTRLVWEPKLINKFLRRLKRVTNCELEDLQHRTITLDEWRKLSEKMGSISARKLQHAWDNSIYTRLFAAEGLDLTKVKAKVVKRLIKRNETDWRTVNWKEVARKFPGFTQLKLYMLFKHLVKYHVPKEKQASLKDALHYLDDAMLKYNIIPTAHKLKKIKYKDKNSDE